METPPPLGNQRMLYWWNLNYTLNAEGGLIRVKVWVQFPAWRSPVAGLAALRRCSQAVCQAPESRRSLGQSTGDTG